MCYNHNREGHSHLSHFFIFPFKFLCCSCFSVFFRSHSSRICGGCIFCENDRETAERFDKIKSGDDFTVD